MTRTALIALALCAGAGAAMAGETDNTINRSESLSLRVTRLSPTDYKFGVLASGRPILPAKSTCEADGVRWPARVEGDAITCRVSDRPTWYERFGAWVRGIAGVTEGKGGEEYTGFRIAHEPLRAILTRPFQRFESEPSPRENAFQRSELALRIKNLESQGRDASLSREALRALDAAAPADPGSAPDQR
jgi:hypothetical protein